MHPEKQKIVFLSLAMLFLISLGCSRKVLTVFFDGVPNPNDSLNMPAPISSKQLANLPDSVRTAENSTQVAASHRSVHPPYLLKKCSLCHDPNAKIKLLLPQPALCNLCHDDFKVVYAYQHEPSGTGSCSTCHNPHTSENEKLLLKTGQQMCLTCHISTDVFQQKAHRDIQARGCTECHNPHGGNSRYFLR